MGRRPVQPSAARSTPRTVLLAGEDRRFVNETQRISEGVPDVEQPFAPWLFDYRLIDRRHPGSFGSFVRPFEVVDREVDVPGVLLGVERIPVGSRIEAGSLGQRDTFADIGQSLALFFGLTPMDYGESFLSRDN